MAVFCNQHGCGSSVAAAATSLETCAAGSGLQQYSEITKMFAEGGNSSFVASAGDSAYYMIWLFSPVIVSLLAFWKCIEVLWQCIQNVYAFFYGKPKAKTSGTKTKSSKSAPCTASKTVTRADGAARIEEY